MKRAVLLVGDADLLAVELGAGGVETFAHDLLVVVEHTLAGFVPEGDFDVIADFAEQLEIVLVLGEGEQRLRLTAGAKL